MITDTYIPQDCLHLKYIEFVGINTNCRTAQRNTHQVPRNEHEELDTCAL